MGPTQPTFGGPVRAVRFTVLGIAVAVVVATAAGWTSHHALFFVGAVAASVGVLLVRVLPRGRAAVALAVLPALTLMQAHTGGAASGYSVLLLAGSVAVGLEGSDRELLAATAILAGCCFVPMLALGAPAYPVRWGDAGMLFAIAIAVLATLRSVTRDSEALTRRLSQEAVVDDLTGLYNRRGWRQTAPGELARSARTGSPVALLTLDLDDLKHVNDHRGHREGDRVLRETASRMRATLRSGDILARLGGDEFVALLTDSTLTGTLTAVERLRATTPSEAGFSVGVAIWDRTEDLYELINRSDQALYAAKAAGGGHTEVAPQPIAPVALERLA